MTSFQTETRFITVQNLKSYGQVRAYVRTQTLPYNFVTDASIVNSRSRSCSHCRRAKANAHMRHTNVSILTWHCNMWTSRGWTVRRAPSYLETIPKSFNGPEVASESDGATLACSIPIALSHCTGDNLSIVKRTILSFFATFSKSDVLF